MKYSPLSLAAVATIAMSSRSFSRFSDLSTGAKILNIDGDGSAAVGGGEAASGGQAATGDEIVQSGDPGVLAAAAMADPSAGQQQQAVGDEQQADGVVIAKGEVVGDEPNGTTAVDDPSGTEQAQQT